jgi:hypothetical protein
MIVRAGYLAPTEKLGSRVRVTSSGESKTVPFDYAADDALTAAVEATHPTKTVTKLSGSPLSAKYRVE